MSKSVVVVGAGLAGLTCAIYLQRSGIEVTVLEASDRVGGRVKTDSVNGYLFDHGFQVINPNYSEIKRLDALSGIEFNEIFSNLRIIEGNENLKVGLDHKLN
ncbi:MAG: FAD-dependent oxidoreductase, partial [Actinobacteria bacterium]|nr:FAD-dependent oxidoreductase [Actinomycetota bacterium]